MRQKTIQQSEYSNLCSGKKRVLNIEQWHDKNLKVLKNAGKEYVNKRGRGKIVAAKEAPVQVRGCQISCTKIGCRSLCLNYVHNLFTKFYKLDYNAQTMFLLKFINLREPKRRRASYTDAISQKNAGFDYNVNGQAVCLKTLANIFSISLKHIRVIQLKLKDGDVAPHDNRGKHMNRPRVVNNENRKAVKRHIESFPTTESYYSRRSSSKLCLNMDMSVRKMHSLFLQTHPEYTTTISLSFYRKIFIREFNLRFGSPPDTCKRCDLNYAKLIAAPNDEERKKIEEGSAKHHMQADAAHKQLAADGKNSSFITLCVDLQQVLFTSNLSHSDVYYQRQYSNYNFAVHNMTSNTANMFLWYEVIAKRGSKEIGSCILKYVTSKWKTLSAGEERKLIVWSDRCVGQNNNKVIPTLYFFLIEVRYFSEIHQKFMSSGHSFLPCDRDFALIERRKKKTKALVPQDWKYIIASSKISTPFTITEMMQSDFKDLDILPQTYMVKNSKFQITQYLWFKMSFDDPTFVFVRESHNMLRPWKIFRLFKYNIPSPILLQLYDRPLPISKEKKKDLLHMVQFFVNEEHKNFYQNLPSV